MAEIYYPDLSIKCERWAWNINTTTAVERNFFGSEDRIKEKVIELTNFLIQGTGPLFSYQREDIDKGDVDASLKLYGSFSTLELLLSNISSEELTNFFEFYSGSASNKRFKVFGLSQGKINFYRSVK